MKALPATIWRFVLAGMGVSLALSAHPMGNFSVNHYSRLFLRDGRVELTYVLDLAEIPTFQLLNESQTDWKDKAALIVQVKQCAGQWVSNLALTQSGGSLQFEIVSVSPKTTEGAGGMPVLRIAIVAHATVEPGAIAYEDRNYPGRAGWKEIVVDHAASAVVRNSSQSAKDISGGLTYYPTDPGITPPQELTAKIMWAPQRTELLPATPNQIAPAVGTPSIPTPAPALPAVSASPSFSQQQPAAPGAVVRGDYLSRLLQRRDLGWRLILLGILAAFGLGAMHAMSPGHGKTIVAAYLVGSRGTLKHAGLLGFVVTFTHTFTVFLLGLGVLFFQQYIAPEKIVPILGVISGLSIVSVGAMLLYRRSMALMDGHGHSHSHGGHTHSHEHQYARRRAAQGASVAVLEANHDHGGYTHSHDGHTHSHMPKGNLTLGSLITFGVSGGLVPCPSALILMLSAIALGRPALGLMLLIGFSTGLAAVLMGIGLLALYVRNLLPDGKETAQRPLFRLIPVFSAVVVICLGLAMSAVSAGWIQPMRFLS